MKKLLVSGLVLLLVVGVPFFALASEGTGTQVIEASIQGFIEVKTADTLIWNLEIGENETSTNVTVDSNDAWTLNVSADNNGYFERDDGGRLASPLNVVVGGSLLPLLEEEGRKVGESKVAGSTSLEVSLRQNVVLMDPQGDYSITIIYTAIPGL